MFRRILIFLSINFLIVISLSLLLNLLGVKPYLTRHGLDYPMLLIFCLIWGMGGAFLSLLLSRPMAKWLMRLQMISPKKGFGSYEYLYHMIEELVKEAGLDTMPEIGIFHSPEINAFATGPTKRRSLIAVSSGLLEKMSEEEIKGVIAHEISHITNGDMVTMTLIQGIVNAFVMFLARVLAFLFAGQDRRSNSQFKYHLFVFFFEIVFLLLGSLVIAWFSRQREYRADKGGAHLAGKARMIGALQKLRQLQHLKDTSLQPSLNSLMIAPLAKKDLLSLFASHPSLEKRIEQLKSIKE